MEPFEHLDHFAILEVGRGAAADEIKRAYRRQMARYHPDRYGTASAAEQHYASSRSQRINEAYQVLSDVTARSVYQRSIASSSAGTAPPRPAPAPFAQRDHQAELYEQAQAHLLAGRRLQALATLRELQQINPFYRDSAALLAKAEALAKQDQRQAAVPVAASSPNRRRILLAFGGLFVTGAAAVAGLRWLRPSGPPPAEPAAGGLAAVAPTSVPTAPPPATIAPAAPTNLPPTTVAAAPSAAAAPATAAPATVAPATAAPATATSAPPSPTSPPALPFVEDGPLLLADDFSAQQRWAVAEGAGWSVGYRDAAYQIIAEPGAGRIWSFTNFAGLADYSLGVDLTVSAGLAGILLRFSDGGNFIAFQIEPLSGRLNLEQRAGARSTLLLNQASPAISSGDGAINRLAVRAVGNQLVLGINGVQVADLALNSPPLSERYGLIAIGGDTRVVARYSNLELRQA